MRIEVLKKARRLRLIAEDGMIRVFPVALGISPVGHKRAEGDGRTPEGQYRISTKNEKSKYHKSLGISYPSAEDAMAALQENRITDMQYAAIFASQGKRPPWDTPLGGFIMIHGGGTDGDWTAGCIALADDDMDEVFSACEVGDGVEIRA